MQLTHVYEGCAAAVQNSAARATNRPAVNDRNIAVIILIIIILVAKLFCSSNSRYQA